MLMPNPTPLNIGGGSIWNFLWPKEPTDSYPWAFGSEIDPLPEYSPSHLAFETFE
jgi:hypothetical protein